MKKNPKKKAPRKKESKAQVDERRLFILQRLTIENRCHISDIKDNCHLIHNKSVDDDIKYFKKHFGLELGKFSDPVDRRKKFLANKELIGFGIVERMAVFQLEKTCIAKTVFSLITGLKQSPLFNERTLKRKRTQFKQYKNEEIPTGARHSEQKSQLQALKNELYWNPAELRSILTDGSDKSIKNLSQNPYNNGQSNRLAIPNNIDAIVNKFSVFWRQHNREIIVDAGTTNLRLAKILADSKYPKGSLSSLTVMTNYHPIFKLLASSTSQVKARIVGGMQVGETNAIAGIESLAFLKAMPFLTFGIAILGATCVSVNQFTACASSYEESELKGVFMQRAAIKILVADDSKFTSDVMRSSRAYTDLSEIDLIITNEPSAKMENRQHNGRDDFFDIISVIRSRGTPVLVTPLAK